MDRQAGQFRPEAVREDAGADHLHVGRAMIVDLHSMHRCRLPAGAARRDVLTVGGSGPSLCELPEAVDIDKREGVALLRRPRLRRE